MSDITSLVGDLRVPLLAQDVPVRFKAATVIESQQKYIAELKDLLEYFVGDRDCYEYDRLIEDFEPCGTCRICRARAALKETP